MTVDPKPMPSAAARKIRLFVSYDRNHDEDLHDLLAEQASRTSAGFEISARSRPPSSSDLQEESLRRAIRQADEVVFLCGEHTEECESVGTELTIAREEERPYLLLWGRRDLMCTKPSTAKPADSMYSWTWEILQRQVQTVRRLANRTHEMAELRKAKGTPKIDGSGTP